QLLQGPPDAVLPCVGAVLPCPSLPVIVTFNNSDELSIQSVCQRLCVCTRSFNHSNIRVRDGFRRCGRDRVSVVQLITDPSKVAFLHGVYGCGNKDHRGNGIAWLQRVTKPHLTQSVVLRREVPGHHFQSSKRLRKQVLQSFRLLISSCDVSVLRSLLVVSRGFSQLQSTVHRRRFMQRRSRPTDEEQRQHALQDEQRHLELDEQRHPQIQDGQRQLALQEPRQLELDEQRHPQIQDGQRQLALPEEQRQLELDEQRQSQQYECPALGPLKPMRRRSQRPQRSLRSVQPAMSLRSRTRHE
ncbi:hypothetical protein BOX15_Mlig017096g4, partial [Macrostomum lignano]